MSEIKITANTEDAVRSLGGLEKAADGAEKAAARATTAVRDHGRWSSSSSRYVSSLAGDVAKVGKSASTTAAKVRGMSAAERDAGRSARTLAASQRAINKEFQVSAKGIVGMTGAYVGLSQAMSIIRGSVETTAEIDTALRKVAKTANLTTEEAAHLAEQFGELSLRAGGVAETKKDLLELAGLAGQLGIAKEDLLSFTEVMARLRSSTDLISEEAMLQFAQFIQLTRAGGTTAAETASALVHLGNNAAAMESAIMANSMRIAQQTVQFQLAAPAILAYATATKESGIEAELAGSSIGRLFGEMQRAISAGGPELEKFAELTGRTAAEFSELFRSDVAAAGVEFFAGLGKEGENTRVTLEELNLGGVRLAGTLPAMAQQVDILRKHLQGASVAASENVALTKESDIAYAGIHATMTRLAEISQNFLTAVGSGVVPVLEDLVSTLQDGGEGVESFGRALGETAGGVISDAVELLSLMAENATAVKGALAAVAAVKVSRMLQGLAGTLSESSIKMQALAGSSSTASVALGTKIPAAMARANAAIATATPILAAVAAGVMAVNSAINTFKADAERAIRENVAGARTVGDTYREVTLRTRELTSANEERLRVERAVAEQGISASNEEARAAVAARVATEVQRERVRLLTELRDRLPAVAAAEREAAAALEKAREEQKALTEEGYAGRDGVAQQAAALDKLAERMPVLERAYNDARSEATQTAAAVGDLTAAVSSFIPASQDAARRSEVMAAGQARAAKAATDGAKAQRLAARRLGETAKAARGAADAVGDDLDSALRSVAKSMASTLRGEMTRGQEAVEDWREQLEAAGEALTAHEAALKAALKTEQEASEAALKAAKTAEDRADIEARSADVIGELKGKLKDAKKAQEELTEARRQDAAVTSGMLSEDRAALEEIESATEGMERQAAAVLAGAGAAERLETATQRAAAWQGVYGEVLRLTAGDHDAAAGAADRYVNAQSRLMSADVIAGLEKEREALELRAESMRDGGAAAKEASVESEVLAAQLAAGVEPGTELAETIRSMVIANSELRDELENQGATWDSVVDKMAAVVDVLRDIETGSADADAALAGLGSGLEAYQRGRAQGQSVSEARAGGVMSGVTSFVSSTGYGGGGQSQFGGRMSGNMSGAGSQAGMSLGGPIGGLIGFVIGGLIQTGADDMTLAIRQAGEKAEAEIVLAEGGLDKVANQISGVLGAFFNNLNTQLGGVLDMGAAGAAELRIRNQRVIVEVGGVVKGFRDLNEAMGYLAEQVLSANENAAGIGDNVRGVFERIGRAEQVGNLEELNQAMALAVAADQVGSTVDSSALASLRQLNASLEEQMRIARDYGLVLSDVLTLQRQQLQAAHDEIAAGRDQLFGASNNVAALRQLAGSMEAYNQASAEQTARNAQRRAELISELGELEAAAEKFGAATDGVAASLDGAVESATAMASAVGPGQAGGRGRVSPGGAGGVTEDEFGGGINARPGGGGLGEVIDHEENVRGLRRTQEEIEALTDALSEIPEQFDPQEIADVWTEGANQAGRALLSMIRQLRGEEYGRAEEQKFANSTMALQLAAQLAAVQALLAATDMLSESSRELLTGLVEDGQAALDALARGEISAPTSGGRGRGRGRERRRERSEMLDQFERIAELGRGATQGLLSVADGIDEVTAAAERAEQLGIAADIIADYVDNALRLQLEDIMAPARERTLQRNETDEETALRRIEEEREETLAAARQVVEAQAAATGQDFAELWAPIFDELNAAFDAEAAEARADAETAAAEAAAERAENLEREAVAAMEAADASRRATESFLVTAGVIDGTAARLAELQRERDRLTMEAAEALDPEEFLETAEAIKRGYDALVRDLAFGTLREVESFVGQFGANLDPSILHAMAVAEFELERARLLSAVTNSELIEVYRQHGIDFAEVVETLTNLEFTMPEEGQPARTRPRPGRATSPGAVPAATAGDDLEAALRALDDMINGWAEDAFGPVARALRQVDEDAATMAERLQDAGAAAGDLARLEEAAAAKRSRILRDHFGQVDDAIFDLTKTDQRLTFRERMEMMRRDFMEAQDAVLSGDVDRLGDALSSSRALADFIRENYDTSGGYGGRLMDDLLSELRLLGLQGDHLQLPAGDPADLAVVAQLSADSDQAQAYRADVLNLQAAQGETLSAILSAVSNIGAVVTSTMPANAAAVRNMEASIRGMRTESTTELRNVGTVTATTGAASNFHLAGINASTTAIRNAVATKNFNPNQSA